jgi:uncharacterized protein (DUF1330 family)
VSEASIRPNKDQFIELMNAPDDTPVVMLNLLKFRAHDGQVEYNKYGDSVIKMVESLGGKLLWLGKVDQTLIGPIDANDWDAAALVQYPSRKAFIEMATSKEYDGIHEHREGGLERTVVLACTQRGGAI